MKTGEQVVSRSLNTVQLKCVQNVVGMGMDWDDGMMRVLLVFVASYMCSITSRLRRYGTLLVGIHSGGRSIFAMD